MDWHAEGAPIVIAWLLLGASALAHSGGMAVTPTQQAQRDAMRLHILHTELAAEEQGLAQADRRKAERAAANDAPGVAEAEEALSAHRRNLQALRAEIDRAAQPPTVRAPAVRQSRRAAAGRGGDGGASWWWDVYGEAPSTVENSAGNGAQGAAATPGRSRWNVYQGGPTP